MPHPHVLLINGASGSGKTTVAEVLASEIKDAHWIHPDGLWSNTPTMAAETILVQAIELALQLHSKSLCIIDCQIRPNLLPAVLDQLGVRRWTNVLLTCPRNVREERLRQRGSGAYEFARVDNWARCLLEEARRRGELVLDTSIGSTTDVSRRIIVRLGMYAWVGGAWLTSEHARGES
jgi:adenylate kinase family enzyme